MAVPRITKEELKARLDAGNAPLIIDVRLKYPFEHSTLTLPGARRVAPSEADTVALPADQDIVVFDSDPGEIVSAEAAGRLRARGLKVAVLAGGLPEWVAANLPTETKEARVAAPAAKGAAKE
jgi:rhodanese-related sulfurtransferase